jgi:pimeloyl-ACP methyl ester carboxylesterase
MARLNSTRLGRFLMRVALYGGAVFVGLPLAFSHVMIRTHRRPTEPPPPRWEETWITSEGLRLRAWLGPAKPGRPAVVVVHGLGDSLESYFPIASVLSGRGHTVLLLDLRGHGASEGNRTTMGGHEREDVRAGMRYLSAQGLAQRGVVLFGFSMGAVAVLRAAADREDVRAVVAESPFDTYRDTVAHHARILYGLPRWFPVIHLAIAAAEWRAGFDADEVDAVRAAGKIRAPLLAIVNGADERMPERVVRRVWDAHPGPKSIWVAPGAEHVGAILHLDYWPRVLGFLEEHKL